MASFLSGLMGGLKSVGSSMGRAGSSLVAAIDPALNGTPGGAARKPGTAGLMGAGELAASDLGDFRLRGRVVEGVRPDGGVGLGPVPAPKQGFFRRINEVDPKTGLSTVDKWDRLGARIQDIGDGGDRASQVDARAKGRISAQQQAELARMIDEQFGDDPRMAFLLKANPEKATAALADVYKSRNEAYTLSQGQRRSANGQMIEYAPETGVDGGYGYRTQADGGIDWLERRAPSYSEEEAGRHNRATEGLSAGDLALDRARLDLDRLRERRIGAGGGGSGGGTPWTRSWN